MSSQLRRPRRCHRACTDCGRDPSAIQLRKPHCAGSRLQHILDLNRMVILLILVNIHTLMPLSCITLVPHMHMRLRVLVSSITILLHNKFVMWLVTVRYSKKPRSCRERNSLLVGIGWFALYISSFNPNIACAKLCRHFGVRWETRVQ